MHTCTVTSSHPQFFSSFFLRLLQASEKQPINFLCSRFVLLQRQPAPRTGSLTRRPRLWGLGLRAQVAHHPTVCLPSAGKIKNKKFHRFKSNAKFWKLVHIDLFLIVWAHLYSGQKIKKTERKKIERKDWVMYLLSVWKAVGSARTDAANCWFCLRKLIDHRQNQRLT